MPQKPIRSTPAAGRSAQLQAAAVLRLLRGESLEDLSRTFGMTVPALKRYRAALQRGGLIAVDATEPDAEGAGELERLRVKIGELSAELERLRPRPAPREGTVVWTPRMSRA